MLGVSGHVISFTTVYVPPTDFKNQAPYIVVLVKTKSHMFTGQLVDYEKDQVKKGMHVQAVLRKIKNPESEGIIPYGIKFKPV